MKHKNGVLMKNVIILSALVFFTGVKAFSQTGISVSPPRLYFEKKQGESHTHDVTVTNVSTTHTLDLAVSLGDWEYDRSGDNVMRPAGTLATSCAAWVNIKENDNYFSLRPGEKKELKVTLTPPADFPDSLPVHTAMLFVTQMNPTESEDVAGANLKVSVRSGIKIFHRTPNPPVKKIEILHMGFNKEAQHIDLQFENRSNVWTDGIVYADLMHTGTGKKTTLPHIVYYSLPGNTRDLTISLPAGLAPGKYIASVLIDYGIEDAVEVAELTFTHE